MSSSSLYGGTSGNVTVSSKNITTLYNTTASNIVTANVPDRNFTTLYGTTTAEIQPSRGYGNANVERFLNAGTDGANTVQSIHMSGSLYVGGNSYLGNVGNVFITGGTYNYVLTTDGTGNLSWTEQQGGGGDGNSTPYIHFDVTSTGNNQQFTDANLEVYSNSYNMNVFKNGINIEPFFYEKSANDTIQVNILLNDGDTLDILASTGGSGTAGGNNFDVQFNGGGLLSGVDTFTYDPVNDLMTVGNITVGGESNLGAVGNVIITGGSANYVLKTDGAGNLSWTAQTGGGSSNSIQNGTSNVSIPTSNGNILFSTNGNANVAIIDTNGVFNSYKSIYVENGSNIQSVIRGLDTANSGVQPSIQFRASAGNLTNPLPLTTPYDSFIAEMPGTSWDGNNWAYGASYVIRYVGAPTGSTPFPYVYGEPSVRYTQQLNSGPGAGHDAYFFENHSGGSMYVGAFDLTTFSTAPYDYTFNIDLGGGSFTTFTMGYDGNFTIPGIYNGDGGGLSNIAVANITGLGNIATLNLTGSSSNVLYGNGVFAAVSSGGTPGGSNTQFQYNNSGSFGGVSQLTYDGTSITANVGNLQLNQYQEDYYSYGSATGTITPDFVDGSIQNLTLTGNITLNSLGNALAGRSMTLILNQDGTGGRTLTSSMKFAGGYKTLSTAPNATDILIVFYSGANYYASLTTGYA
jgi:hypothetical protein